MEVPTAKITAEARRNTARATRSGSREDLMNELRSLERMHGTAVGSSPAASVRTTDREPGVPAGSGRWPAPGSGHRPPTVEGVGRRQMVSPRGTPRALPGDD